MEKKTLRNDILLMLSFLAAAGAVWLLFLMPGKAGSTAVITQNGSEIMTVSLLRDDEFRIESGNGYNVVSVKDGKIEVAEASCPDKVCRNHRPVSSPGETIVCVPNGLVITVSGDGMEVDAVS